MMAISRWITNLESREALESERDKAQAAVDADPEDGRARADLNRALTNLVLGDRTMELIRQEYGDVTIGDPQGTDHRTAEAIKADGYVGVYRQGAGRG